jgi:quercetin dioxygenase-like cupin family protein
MSTFALRLFEDRFDPRAHLVRPLPATHRIIYLVQGSATITADGSTNELEPHEMWHGTEPASIAAGDTGGLMLRWEVIKLPANDGTARAPGISSKAKITAPVALMPRGAYLIRFERVDYPAGGVAPLHTHQGPRLCCLLSGELTVKVTGSSNLIEPLAAWFEAGPDPVSAVASPRTPTTLARLMLLPRDLLGKSSAQYVHPEDREKSASLRDTVLLDQPIALV